ncbi:MAG: acyltransferase family protein [Prevotella sp.]|nr:acyltransferase family protein [Prevotella sp.]
MADKKRYENIDFMKGVCILLVVATHLDLPYLSEPCYSLFRMPMYYFLSGIFFSRYDGIKTFLIKKTNNLIVPYLFFSIFTLLVILVFYFGKHTSFEEAYIESEPLHNGPIWFLISLYEVGVLMYVISGIKRLWLHCAMFFLLSITGFCLCDK